MSQRSNQLSARFCPGPANYTQPRREFLQFGLAGFASLSLPRILRLRAQSGLQAGEQSPARREKTAVIMVWQPGGMSHLESYDPKPNSEVEYAGPFGTIATKVSGLQFCELTA